MKAQEIIEVLKTACKENRVCKAQLTNEPSPRVLNPFGVCLTAKRELVIVYIHAGSQTGSSPQLRVLRVEDCAEIEMLNETFKVDSNIDPDTLQNDIWVFHSGQN